MNKVKKKIYINTLLLSVTVLSLMYVNMFYLTENIKNTSAEIIEKKKSIESLTTQNSQIQNIRIKTEESQQSINKASEYIVDYSNISDFVAEMKKTAMENNIELDMKVSDKDKTEITNGLSYINYNIKTIGGFNETIQFLIYLENSKYYSNVEKIKISSNDDKIILDLVLKVYTWE